MIYSYLQYWRGYFDFDGQSSRSEFWWPVLLNTILIIILALVSESVAVITLFSWGTLIPNLSSAVRRLRDANIHWAWIFLIFIPFGNLVLLFFLCQPTDG